MRKLWVKAWTTFDGVYDADTMDHWWQNTNSPERMQYVKEEYEKGDAYLLGRVTYEMLWPGWSTQTTGDGPGPILNRMHKYVVSTTLSTAPWKESTIISGNVVDEIAKLKQQPGKDIIIDGSGTLVQSLMGTDLIDEYRFLVQPFIMGRGRRFFPDGTPPTTSKLVESKALSFGSLALVYQPDKMTAPLKFMNAALAFLLELGMLVAFGYWGFYGDKSVLAKWLLGIGLPVLTAVAWGMFLAPRATHRLGNISGNLLSLILFLSAAAALFYTGHPLLGIIFASVAVVNRALILLWKQW